MKIENKGLLQVHIAVFLFGMSGLFAKMVALSGIVITFGRVLFSSVFLLVLLKLQKTDIRLKHKKDYIAMFGVGIILAIHWTAYMMSIQSSTVAVGTILVSAFPVFVTFLEPVLFREKLRLSNVITAFIMLAGVVFLVPKFELSNKMVLGVIWGLISSFTYAVLSLCNRKFAGDYSGKIVSLYEQGAAAIVLLPAMFIIKPSFGKMDVAGLLLYGIVCTALAHSMFIEGLKHIRVQTAGLISGLESVYSIILAAILLGEFPGKRELLGGMIVLGVALYTTLKSDKRGKKEC